MIKKVLYGLLVAIVFLAVGCAGLGLIKEDPWPEKWMSVYELVEKYGVVKEDSPSVKGFDITWIDSENKTMAWRMMAGTGKDRIGIFLACYDIEDLESGIVITGFSLYFDMATHQYTLITPSGISEPRADIAEDILTRWLELYKKHPVKE